MPSPLVDLDELTLKCRSHKAREYIKEAVACYKSGAFRSAIVSSWIASVFDLLEKFKDLAVLGDLEAQQIIESFEEASRSGDFVYSLRFERDVLDIARDKFELISHVEHIDLVRLRDDRNRCAHPSVINLDEIFNPSAELARYHIRSAVEHLLQHPPAQGKYALNILMEQVSSEYFPSSAEDVLVTLKRSPLVRAKRSLIRNFIICTIKDFIKKDVLQLDYKTEQKTKSILSAIQSLHGGVFYEVIDEKLSDIVKGMDDDQLEIAIKIVFLIDSGWSYLKEDIQKKLIIFIENLPCKKLSALESMLSIAEAEISTAAMNRVNKLTYQELKEIFTITEHPAVIEKYVEAYSNSQSFAEANWLGNAISWHANLVTKEQIIHIISACSKNSQIMQSNGWPATLGFFRKNKNITIAEIDEELRKCGLTQFVVTTPD
ncbi:hypothetical protein J9978_08710 [Chromobacterium violaceum]|uniref:hypothetical protein n=1 Tax=Chromobacterium violaceum TaxID=536 RepID=UPI001B32C7B6|nr:hypothetical protein [Chromobacterium violaceum]MBP4049578.1 hypothetical protein [Chromobacterium violaceum]